MIMNAGVAAGREIRTDAEKNVVLQTVVRLLHAGKHGVEADPDPVQQAVLLFCGLFA